MALQLDLPATPSAESAPPAVWTTGQFRPEEPAVPVYRHFLCGGPNEFRLGVPASMGLVVSSVVGVLVASLLAGRIVSPVAAIGATISAVLVCLPLAELVSRWAGRTSGTPTGLLTVAGWTALSCFAAPPLMLAATAAIASILVYGMAELPNRTPTFSRATAAVLFYVCASLSCVFAGPAPLAPIAAVCLGTLLGNENSRGIRFFVSPVGLLMLLMGVAIGILTAGAVEASGTLWPQWLAMASLAVGLTWSWASVRSGHAASPLGRLLLSWLLAPSLLAVLGLISAELATAITFPAWAAMIGPAVATLRRRLRKKRPSC